MARCSFRADQRRQGGALGQFDGEVLLVFLVLFVVVVGYLAYTRLVHVPEPKNVPQLHGAAFQDQLRRDQVPSLVLFYSSPDGWAARYYFQVMEYLAGRFDSKVNFYLHRLDNVADDPYFKDYGERKGVLVLYKNGKAILKKNLEYFSAPEANLGYAFMMIRDEIGSRRFGIFDDLALAGDSVMGVDLYERILKTKGLVVLALVSSECSASRSFRSVFERVANEQGRFAKFYITESKSDGSNKTEYSRIMHAVELYKVPAIAVFQDGQLKAKRSGGFQSSEGNEAQIMGMIVPYL